MRASTSILALNAGSSSIKFVVYQSTPALKASLRGTVERIGLDGTTLSWRLADGAPQQEKLNGESAPGRFLEWLQAQDAFAAVGAVGHRIVHGLTRTAPALITPDVLAELRRATPYAPEHLPREIELIDALHDRCPQLTQIACFDTAFHSEMPALAKLLPIPRRYYRQGVRRYGFHGLSYAYLIDELARAGGQHAATGRVILAHLGNGASLAALKGGASVDTTMGFTPSAGLVMATRTGDLDPGVMAFLARSEGITATQFDRMINHESGLLGVSEVSSDMRDLIAREGVDQRAAEAVGLFCYQARKWIGALAAALGGLETLVFSAGIGERSAVIRHRICEGLGFLGIHVDPARNDANAAVISTDASPVTVRVIPTDEELMIARSVSRICDLNLHTQERDA